MKQSVKRLIALICSFMIITIIVPFSTYADDNVKTDNDFIEITEETESQEFCKSEAPLILADNDFETSGNCGENLTWHYDITTNVLTVEGYGEMENYQGQYGTPWTPFHQDITRVILPDGITNIGDNAFCGCSKITEINIPDSVTSIGNFAFRECKKIKELTIPDSVVSIGEQAFYYCESVPEIKLPESVTNIEKSAFWGCRSITSFIIPKNVTELKRTTFDSCSNLESVVIPDGVTSIGDEVFVNCFKLKSITIPESVAYIGDDAFADTPWLDIKRAENPLVIVNNIVADGRQCTGNVVIPDNIVSISDNAFEYNKELVSVSFPDTLKSIGNYAFRNCINLESASIPESLTSLKSGLFSCCEKLTNADIPENITEIQSSVFENTGITDVRIRNPYCNIALWNDTFPENTVIHGYDNSTAKAYAEKFNREFILLSGEPNVKLEYSYEIKPLISPSNEYFYIKTDDPNPSHFRFADSDSAYSDDIALFEKSSTKFADVKYVDEETLRVNGGYIFYCGNTDGGEVTLQIYLNEWFDTGITYTLPRLYDTADYLIHTYATKSDFWDNMDSVQAGFSSICLYSGSYIRGEVYKPGTFYGVSNSPHIDQSFYIQTPYRRKNGESLFASAIYPFRYDSLGFPSIMATVAKRLDSSASCLVSSSNHYTMNVTYNGETHQYGGAGTGEGQGITKDKIIRYFTFDDYKEDITLENIKQLLGKYAKLDMPDDFSHDDQLLWSDVADTVGNGSWVSVIGLKSVWGGTSNVYSYFYKANNENYYSESDMGEGASHYWGGSLKYASDAWVDGRYVDSYEKFVPGEKFEDHKESDIILSDITIPVLEYDRTGQYNSKTGEYEYNYTNIKISESMHNIVRYVYNSQENVWKADSDTMNIVGSSLSDISNMTAQGLIPEKYLKALKLTYEQVISLNVDRNTDISPRQFYIYNQTAEPGTKVISGDANNDGKVNIADAVMLQNWLLNSGDLTCWYNVDLYADKRIDVFDFCLLKNLIVENS